MLGKGFSETVSKNKVLENTKTLSLQKENELVETISLRSFHTVNLSNFSVLFNRSSN